jgi:hypothetical protein
VSEMALEDSPKEVGGKGTAVRLLEFHGERMRSGSYLVKAAQELHLMGATFTAPMLSRRAGIPRPKGYPVIQRLCELGLLEEVPKLPDPLGWRGFSKGRRRRFKVEQGRPLRGLDPQRYRYTPVRALARARDVLMRRVDEVDLEAQERVADLLDDYRELEEGLLREF